MAQVPHQSISALVIAALVAGCGGDGGNSRSNGNGGSDAAADGRIEGTITLPADATGRCAMVALDTDTTGSNGSAKRADGEALESNSRVSGTAVSFAFEGVPAGMYFLWGYVDSDGSASTPPSCEITSGPNSGDHLGYYDTGLGPPSSANVAVPHGDGVTFDFQLGVFP